MQSPASTTAAAAEAAAPTVLIPCAACKVLRRRCAADGCVLAPYFPAAEPGRFAVAHRVFGASNIAKLLRELPEACRADAASSMVYEAEARARDPVYGCAGAVCRLQRRVEELKMELARAQAELVAARARLQAAAARDDALLLQALCGGGSAPASPQWLPEIRRTPSTSGLEYYMMDV